MKKLNISLFLIGLVFVVFLIWNFGVEKLWQQLIILGWSLLPFVLCEGASELIHAIGWRYCLNEPYRSLPLSTLFQIRMSGYAINYLAPTACLGGEASKAILLSSYHSGPGAVSGVLVDKVCHALAHVLVVAVGSLFCLWHVDLSKPLWLSMMAGGALVFAGVVAFLIIQRYGKCGAIVRWLVERKIGGQALAQLALNITRVDEALSAFYQGRVLDMWLTVGWHVVGFAVGIIQIWLFFYFQAPEVSLALATTAWLLGMWFDLVTFAVPLNAGSLEGSRILTFKVIGYGSLLGMTYAVALRIAQLFWASVGLILYGLGAGSGVSRVREEPYQTKVG